MEVTIRINNGFIQVKRIDTQLVAMQVRQDEDKATAWFTNGQARQLISALSVVLEQEEQDNE